MFKTIALLLLVLALPAAAIADDFTPGAVTLSAAPLDTVHTLPASLLSFMSFPSFMSFFLP